MFGIAATFCKFSVFDDITVFDASYAAIELKNGYGNRVTMTAQHINSTSIGYGIAVAHAECSGTYTPLTQWTRHGFATGGGGTDAGIPWNFTCVNGDVYTNFTHGYDCHAAVGTGRFINCKAYGGIYDNDTTSFAGIWHTDSTYSTGEIVSYNDILYTSAANGNQGNSPTAKASTYWTLYRPTSYGFSISSTMPIAITNCEVRNHDIAVKIFSKGYTSYDNYDKYGFSINGLYCYNVRNVIAASSLTMNDFFFDNIYCYNPTWKAFTNGYNSIIRLQSDTLNNVYFGKMIGKGIGGIYADSLVIDGDKTHLAFQELECEGQIIYQPRQVDNISYYFKKVKCTDNASTSLNLDINGAGCKNIYVDDLTLIDFDGTFIQTRQALTDLTFGKVKVHSPSGAGQIFITPGANITNLYIGDFSAYDDAFNILVQKSSYTITNASLGRVSGVGALYNPGSGETVFTNGFIIDGDYRRTTTPFLRSDKEKTILYLDGTLKVIPRSAAVATPEAGMIYYDSDDNHFYGYNGTGWIQLDN